MKAKKEKDKDKEKIAEINNDTIDFIGFTKQLVKIQESISHMNKDNAALKSQTEELKLQNTEMMTFIQAQNNFHKDFESKLLNRLDLLENKISSPLSNYSSNSISSTSSSSFLNNSNLTPYNKAIASASKDSGNSVVSSSSSAYEIALDNLVTNTNIDLNDPLNSGNADYMRSFIKGIDISKSLGILVPNNEYMNVLKEVSELSANTTEDKYANLEQYKKMEEYINELRNTTTSTSDEHFDEGSNKGDDDNKQGTVNKVNTSIISFKRAINELIGSLALKSKYIHKPNIIQINKDTRHKLQSSNSLKKEMICDMIVTYLFNDLTKYELHDSLLSTNPKYQLDYGGIELPDRKEIMLLFETKIRNQYSNDIKKLNRSRSEEERVKDDSKVKKPKKETNNNPKKETDDTTTENNGAATSAINENKKSTVKSVTTTSKSPANNKNITKATYESLNNMIRNAADTAENAVKDLSSSKNNSASKSAAHEDGKKN